MHQWMKLILTILNKSDLVMSYPNISFLLVIVERFSSSWFSVLQIIFHKGLKVKKYVTISTNYKKIIVWWIFSSLSLSHSDYKMYDVKIIILLMMKTKCDEDFKLHQNDNWSVIYFWCIPFEKFLKLIRIYFIYT